MTDKIHSPGDAIKAELEKRGWTQYDLASVLGTYQPEVNALIQSKRSITPETAMALGAAFGNPPEYWLSIDANYRVSLLAPKSDVERRSRFFGIAPVKDMEKRGWIRATNSADGLEQELCRFFNISSIEQTPKLHVNARQPLQTVSLDQAQIAWCIRAGKMAATLSIKSFKQDQLKAAFPGIRLLADYPEKLKHLPKIMAELGIRLVIVEPISSCKIDGAAFWLADDAPVIVLSARFDRIDCLWFTLAHEMMHIFHNDAQSVDADLVGESAATDLEEIESRANREAADFLIPADKLKSFIIRVKPFYSKERIIQFSHRMQIHPGIVSGQLQFQRQIGWHTNREMLVKVRHHITATALTDGWGKAVLPL